MNPKVTFRDRILPVQAVYREHYEGDEEALISALYEAVIRFGGLRDPRDEFEIATSDKVTVEEMASNPVLLRLLELLVLIKQPRQILEVGTFIGLATLCMARALRNDGKITTIEKYDHFVSIARQNFVRNRLLDKIELIEGDAFEEIPKLSASKAFDMIFLDGNKELYGVYFKMLDPLLASQGLFVIDDVFFHGDVFNVTPRSGKGLGVRRFLEQVEGNSDYMKVILPMGNGVMLMWKRPKGER